MSQQGTRKSAFLKIWIKGAKIQERADTPYAIGYISELEASPEVEPNASSYSHPLIGIMR